MEVRFNGGSGFESLCGGQFSAYFALRSPPVVTKETEISGQGTLGGYVVRISMQPTSRSATVFLGHNTTALGTVELPATSPAVAPLMTNCSSRTTSAGQLIWTDLRVEYDQGQVRVRRSGCAGASEGRGGGGRCEGMGDRGLQRGRATLSCRRWCLILPLVRLRGGVSAPTCCTCIYI